MIIYNFLWYMVKSFIACQVFWALTLQIFFFGVKYMQWILHDWSDEHCIKILKNCRKAIPEKTGKVIIVDHVLRPEGNELFTDVGIAFDMMLLAHNAGGKERTEENWKWLFKETGFARYNIIKINALPSIIEAFPI